MIDISGVKDELVKIIVDEAKDLLHGEEGAIKEFATDIATRTAELAFAGDKPGLARLKEDVDMLLEAARIETAVHARNAIKRVISVAGGVVMALVMKGGAA